MDSTEDTSKSQEAVIGDSKSPKTSKSNKKRLFIYVATFAILGVIALIVTLALTPGNGDFEAETMTVEAL